MTFLVKMFGHCSKLARSSKGLQVTVGFWELLVL
jgi:hypothetical protein